MCFQTVFHKPSESPPLGPYTPAVEINLSGLRTLYVSGQGTSDPTTGEKFLGDIERQAQFAMSNLQRVLHACGFTLSDVVKTTLFLADIAYIPVVNGVYASFFEDHRQPARSTVAVAALPGGMAVEIEAVAVRSEK